MHNAVQDKKKEMSSIAMITTILTHEYTLAMYGVVAWQLNKFFMSKKTLRQYHREAWREMGQALVWVGIAVVFDDEILAQYNDWAEMDYHAPEPWMYIMAGFSITVLRTKIADRLGLKETPPKVEG